MKFDNSYSRLPNRFYERIAPEKSIIPSIVLVNEALAYEFGLDKTAEFFSGNYIAPGSSPLALAYAGHQFGRFVPVLGDGRAHYLGELVNKGGKRFDIQLKGSGRTQFSRNGDGRATLGSVMREYIVSEAMHALGIRTTRSLAIVKTGKFVQREKALPGAILTRIASSHIRIGTFEYFASSGDLEGVKMLADYAIKRHYSDCRQYADFLKEVIDSYAKLVASWMGIGFIHGVMNTDNTSIAGETIDYGPCAFMDEYDHNKVFSSIDKHGRYAYSNQPSIAKWNLERLADALASLVDRDHAASLIAEFDGIYQAHWLAVMRKKLGLLSEHKDDAKLINELLEIMHKEKLDFTITFRSLSTLLSQSSSSLCGEDDAWISSWTKRLASEGKPIAEHINLMNSSNPAFIPRNHLLEAAIKSATEANDFYMMNEMISVLEKPYTDQPAYQKYATAPKEEERICKTFCGT